MFIDLQVECTKLEILMANYSRQEITRVKQPMLRHLKHVLSSKTQVNSPCLRVGAFSMVRIPCHGTSGEDFSGVYGEATAVSSEEHPIALGPRSLYSDKLLPVGA
jgi:hypothetical protein